MVRIVVTEFVSLDGVIEAPGGGEGYEPVGEDSEDVTLLREAFAAPELHTPGGASSIEAQP